MAKYPGVTEPTTSAASPVTSSLVAPIPVPTHGAGGTFSILAKTRVAAPPQEVLSLIRNTNEWHLWNSFCPRCVITPNSSNVPEGPLATGKEGWLEKGTSATIEVFMNGNGLEEGKKKSRDQGITVTVLDEIGEVGKKGYRIAWKSTGWSHWQMHSERVMEFIETEQGGTEYICWETFGGLLGSVIKATVGGQLIDRFGDYAKDVKEFLEVDAPKVVANGST